MPQGWEKEGFLEIRDGRLHIDGVDASALAREYGTPLFVFSESRIKHNIARITRTASLIDRPFKVCYAAKAMSTMAILRVVRDAGIDIEVNSGGELWKALKAGFTGGQIIFNGTSKEVWELEMAISSDIYAIQVDSLYELSLIDETATRLAKRANVSLRLVPEIETKTHSGLQTALRTSKFGMMPDEALQAFAQYKDSPHVDLCGIHAHVGSQNPDPSVYTKACEMLFDTLVRIHDASGVRLKHINIGGGFPVDYSGGILSGLHPEMRLQVRESIDQGYFEVPRPTGDAMRVPVPKHLVAQYERETMLNAGYDPAEALSTSWNSVESIARQSGRSELLDGVTVLTEPGRSIIADAGLCLTMVRNLKQRPLTDINDALSDPTKKAKDESQRAGFGGGSGIGSGVSGHASIGGRSYETHRGFIDRSITAEHWLLTDAGFNILLSMETYKWYYHLISADRAGEEHDFPYKLAGPLCDGGDVYFDIEGEKRLPDYRLLPKDVEPGEVLALLNCGAYSLAQASQYNGRFLPAVVLIKDNSGVELIRRRESFEDLVRSDS
jgi:diaminopimelate decarboxylase